jgi:hypothetical protein
MSQKLTLSESPLHVGNLAYSSGYQFYVESITFVSRLDDGRICVQYVGVATDNHPSNERLPEGYRRACYSWREGEPVER